MIPSIDALIRAGTLLTEESEDSLLYANQCASAGLVDKAKAYHGQAHDYYQVARMLLEQVEARKQLTSQQG